MKQTEINSHNIANNNSRDYCEDFEDLRLQQYVRLENIIKRFTLNLTTKSNKGTMSN